MLKYNRQFIIFLILLGFNQPQLLAQEANDILLLDNELSLYYQRGENLLYDCKEKHWVCTGELEKVRCLVDRQSSILDNEDALPCAVILKLKTHKECTKLQGALVRRAMGNRFCIHPKLREQYKTY